MSLRAYIMTLSLSLGLGQFGFAQVQSPNAKRSMKKITLREAQTRVAAARAQLEQDKSTLERVRTQMDPGKYQFRLTQLKQREDMIKAKEDKLDKTIKASVTEHKIREESGAKFYEEQESYYKHIGSDDLDMAL